MVERGVVVDGRFEVERLAGRGGMGSVYSARDQSTKRRVALKVMEGPGEALPRFVLESKILANLRHPSIVGHVAHGFHEGRAYLVMEWLDGVDLERRLATEPLSIEESVEIARRVASGLAAAHEQGVIHRDLKPSNVFLEGGSPRAARILDFGVARLGGGHGLTATRTTLGTPGYMAPEQARGDSDIDARADVYSLGCVLFECIAGKPLFEGAHPMAILAKVLVGQTPRLRDVRPEVSESLDELVVQMLARDKADRPASASELVTRLAASSLLANGASARPPPRAALSDEERRMLSVVVVPSAPVDALDETRDAIAPPSQRSGIRMLVASLGAEIEPLADGSVVVTMSVGGAATDQASAAAKIALALAQETGGLPIALATGNLKRGSLWAGGDVIDRAVAMLASAPAASVVVDETTERLLDDSFELAHEDGRTLLRRRNTAPAIRSLLGRAAPFLGRERELTNVLSILEQCWTEHEARPVLVIAPAGGGKSRLASELLAKIEARDEAVTMLHAKGDPLSAGSPYALASQIAETALGIPHGCGDARYEELTAKVAAIVPAEDVLGVADFLGEMLRMPCQEASPLLVAARRDPRQLGDRIAAAFQTLIAAVVKRGPMLLVVEDLHWGDLPSISVIDGTLREHAPLAVLALARPEVRTAFPNVWASRGIEEVVLAPLTKRAATRLVEAALGSSAPPETVASIVERADGNPFALEELVRAAALGRKDAPETVLAMVQWRFESMRAELRTVLRAASIFGREASAAALSALLPDTTRDAIEAAAAEIVAAEVFERKLPNADGDTVYAFRHALLRDAAYAMLTEDDRRLGHALAGAHLLASHERDPLILAEHFERGGLLERAIGFYTDAASRALAGIDTAGALAHAERAVRCGASGVALGQLRAIQAEAHGWDGKNELAQKHALSAMELLPKATPPWFVAIAWAIQASVKLGDRIEELDEALRSAVVDPKVERTSLLDATRGLAYLLQVSDIGQGPLFTLLDRMVREVAPEDTITIAKIDGARAVAALSSGDLGETVRLAGLACARLVELGELRGTCPMLVGSGFAATEIGDHAEAERRLLRAIEIGTKLGLRNLVAGAKNNLGLALFRLGRITEAIELERDAAALARAAGDRRLEGVCRIYLARILLDSEDIAGAEREVRAAIDLVATLPPSHAYASSVLAKVSLAKGDVAGALAADDAAMRSLVIAGAMMDGESFIRLTHAEVLHAAEKKDAARDAIREAKRVLDARMRNITDPSARQGFAERVPENARTTTMYEKLTGEP